MAPSPSSFLESVSLVLGWCYFAAWSISFWPQAVLNYQRQSVTGLSFEFLAYNVTGFLLYSTYSTVKFFVPNGCSLSVEINDLAFGYHAVLLTALTIVQCVIYRTERQRVHPIHGFIVASLWLLTGYTLVLCFVADVPLLPKCSSTKDADGTTHTAYETRFSLIDWMGYVKVFISVIKYAPQAWLNYQRQSTVGWSIVNILLDFTGGSLSLAQQCVDSIVAGDTGPIFGNVPKLLLAMESMAFDVLFMVQHYVLYRDRGGKGGKDRLVDGEKAAEGDGAETDEGKGANGEQHEGEDEGQVEGAVGPGRAGKKKRARRSLRLLDGGEDGYPRDGAADVDAPYYRVPEVIADDSVDDLVEQPGFSSPARIGRVNQGGGRSSFNRPHPSSSSAGRGPSSPRLTVFDRYSDDVPAGRR